MKILVAYDASDSSERALDWALSFQDGQDSDIEVVTVVPPISNNLFMYETQPLSLTALYESQKKCTKKMMQDLLEKYASQGKHLNTQVLEGNIADALLSHSEKTKADLIVSGTRGHGGFAGLLMGSIAQKLVTYAKIPVTIIK